MSPSRKFTQEEAEGVLETLSGSVPDLVVCRICGNDSIAMLPGIATILLAPGTPYKDGTLPAGDPTVELDVIMTTCSSCKNIQIYDAHALGVDS